MYPGTEKHTMYNKQSSVWQTTGTDKVHAQRSLSFVSRFAHNGPGSANRAAIAGKGNFFGCKFKHSHIVHHFLLCVSVSWEVQAILWTSRKIIWHFSVKDF
jgi:hypothetical protein